MATQSTETLIRRLASSFKRYLSYQETYIKLTLTEKLSLLLTALILGAIIFVIGVIAIIFMALTLSAALHAWTGSACLGHAIVALLFIGLCVLLFAKRKTWIEAPLMIFFSNLLLDNTDDDENELS